MYKNGPTIKTTIKLTSVRVLCVFHLLLLFFLDKSKIGNLKGHGLVLECIKIWNRVFSALCDNLDTVRLFPGKIFELLSTAPEQTIVTARTLYDTCG